MISLPEIDATERTPGELTLRFVVQGTSRYFEGHFPDIPLLPGVVQIGWAIELGRLHLGAGAPGKSFHSLAGVKFTRVIQPGANVTLRLSLDADGRELAFAYEAGGHDCSNGRILFQ